MSRRARTLRCMRGTLTVLLSAGLTLAASAGMARADSPRGPLAEGNRLYAQGKYGEALAAYREGLLKYPSVPELHYGAGNALYRLKRFEEAAREYDVASSDHPEGDVRGVSRYNQGDAEVRQNQLSEALENYRQALRDRPEDTDAKFNYELIKARLEQQKNQQQQKNPRQGGSPQQQRQDKQPRNPEERPKPQGGEQNQQQKAGRSMRDPQQLSQGQAEQILKALASDEQRLERDRLKARVTNRRPEKDW